MKLKKYEAKTEKEAIELIKNDLGTNAIVLNIRKIQPKGIKSFFIKPSVQVTAAYSDEKNEDGEEPIYTFCDDQNNNHLRQIKILEQQKNVLKLQKNLYDKENIIENLANKLENMSKQISLNKIKYSNNMIQMVYEILLKRGVLQEIADEIFDEIASVENIDINFIVKIAYNSIINIIGISDKINICKMSDNETKVVVFIGPTGVGKTTTIAKLSSNFILSENLEVGLITADTYRIAAIEQLKTYAEILNIEVGVVYNTEDMIKTVDNMKKNKDIIFVDTAGRSHKNNQAFEELKDMLKHLDFADKYVVLSATTKYEDLIKIIDSYEKMTDFKIIFTKTDETSYLGNIINICYKTGKKISYITNGQSVPDDIEIFNPEKIAKLILGFEGDS